MDTLFLETIEFKVDHLVAVQCGTAVSREEVLRGLMEHVGLELIDYGSFTVRPCMTPRPWPPTFDQVDAYSVAYRARAERAAGHR